jgi:hypothetical protein
MIPMFYLTLPDCQKLIHLQHMVSVEVTEYGIDIIMDDPNASLSLQCPPAVAKGVHASIYNAICHYNAAYYSQWNGVRV